MVFTSIRTKWDCTIQQTPLSGHTKVHHSPQQLRVCEQTRAFEENSLSSQHLLKYFYPPVRFHELWTLLHFFPHTQSSESITTKGSQRHTSLEISFSNVGVFFDKAMLVNGRIRTENYYSDIKAHGRLGS